MAYPLAYAMAFKAGRWRNLMMICVVAPFFTSFILRTFAWSQILADEGWVASVARTSSTCCRAGTSSTPRSR